MSDKFEKLKITDANYKSGLLLLETQVSKNHVTKAFIKVFPEGYTGKANPTGMELLFKGDKIYVFSFILGNRTLLEEDCYFIINSELDYENDDFDAKNAIIVRNQTEINQSLPKLNHVINNGVLHDKMEKINYNYDVKRKEISAYAKTTLETVLQKIVDFLESSDTSFEINIIKEEFLILSKLNLEALLEESQNKNILQMFKFSLMPNFEWPDNPLFDKLTEAIRNKEEEFIYFREDLKWLTQAVALTKLMYGKTAKLHIYHNRIELEYPEEQPIVSDFDNIDYDVAFGLIDQFEFFISMMIQKSGLFIRNGVTFKEFIEGKNTRSEKFIFRDYNVNEELKKHEFRLPTHEKFKNDVLIVGEEDNLKEKLFRKATEELIEREQGVLPFLSSFCEFDCWNLKDARELFNSLGLSPVVYSTLEKLKEENEEECFDIIIGKMEEIRDFSDTLALYLSYFE